MSPERLGPRATRDAVPSAWRDAGVGAVAAAPLALLLSQVDQASYRGGAAAMAFLVVVGLASRWTVTAGAAPVILVGLCARVTHNFASVPGPGRAIGVLVMAVSAGIVVLALRRWEGDRRRARAEAQARQRNERRLQALVGFAQQLAGVADRPALLAAVEHQVATVTGCQRVVLAVGDERRLEFPAVAGHGVEDFPLSMPPELLAAGTPATDVLRSGEPVFCRTRAELLARYPTMDRFATVTGQNAWAALPVPPLGALILTWQFEQVFSVAQRAFLTTVASLLGAAADRISAVERSELQRFVGAFDAMVDGVGIYRAVRDAAGRVVDFEIEYLNPASVNVGSDRRALMGHRLREIWPQNPFADAYAEVITSGVPFVIEDADNEALGAAASEATTVSIRASRLDAERIVLVVRDVSERTRLVRAIEEANQVFKVAQRLAHVGSWRYDFATDHLEWSDELYRIVGVPSDLPPVRPDHGSLFGFEHPDDRGRIASTISKAIEQRSPFTFDMRIVRQDDGEVREVSTSGTILVDDLNAVTGVWGATQDVTDRRRAERARREALDALERERDAVGALQRAILPLELPTIDGVRLSAHYRAAALPHAVGGDWYDAFVAPDGRIVVAIGDVAGHGIECAALANQLRISVRVRINDGMTPGAILSRLAAEVGDGFVTSWLGVLDPRTQEMTYASAGHLPALLMRAGSAHFVADRTSPPLGAHLVETSKEASLLLDRGDLLVLYTDGLVEHRQEDLPTGMHRLAVAACTATGSPDPALALVEGLVDDAADDVCVLAVELA